jgi:hypothetical protein
VADVHGREADKEFVVLEVAIVAVVDLLTLADVRILHRGQFGT